MRILVTGGAGFIGSNFIRYVLGLDKGYTVVNYDKLTYAGNLANLDSVAANPGYRFLKGDICDAISVAAAMAGCDTVVHFAAESHVDRSIYEPAASIETNVKGTFILLQVARDLNIKRFVHISTDEVYGDLRPGTFADEDSPLRPSSPYSSSKAGSDLLVLSYVRTYGFPAVITRSSNNYGSYQFPEKFLPLMITTRSTTSRFPFMATENSSAIGSMSRTIAVESSRSSKVDASARYIILAAATSKRIYRWHGVCFARWESRKPCSHTCRIARATTAATL